MESKTPNYLYPLATERKLQWTKDAVKGENEATTPFTPKRQNSVKKGIIKDLVKGKSKVFNKSVATRDNLNPLLKAKLPEDPMRSSDPKPGNAMHITNTKAFYNGYQK